MAFLMHVSHDSSGSTCAHRLHALGVRRGAVRAAGRLLPPGPQDGRKLVCTLLHGSNCPLIILRL